MDIQTASHMEPWPDLPLEAWRDTYATLHLWTQIVGKIRMVQSPWVNHAWHVTLVVTARGLTTTSIPYGTRTFQIDFDFIAHRLTIQSSVGGMASFSLQTQSVATFYARLMAELDALQLHVELHLLPCEVADPQPFDQDETHCAYDPEFAARFWQVLVQADRVFKQFRARFMGKCSPVHFFWGAPDLAVTRFSGRPAPRHPGGIPHLSDAVTREAYSHEVSSAGFWPGDNQRPPSFYSYAYPTPPGFSGAAVQPPEAYFDAALGEFLLPYDADQMREDPDHALLRFLQSTYEAAASMAHWDRAARERPSGPIGKPPV